MSDKTVQSRRDLLKLASVAGAAGLLSPSLAALAKEAGRSEKPLKAAFSNAGLQATWCAQGKQAAQIRRCQLRHGLAARHGNISSAASTLKVRSRPS